MNKYESYLRQNLSKYRYPDQAKTDIIQALAAYNDLRPEVQPFTFNDGVTRQMMSLNGTLPVNYQGNCYNIPICVFVLDTHPYNPPMVFVRPTSTMQIKQGRHVDCNGKIYLPYLSDWNPQSKSSLEGLLGILQVIFSEQPPVFSKPPPGTNPSPSFPRMPAPGVGSIPSATQPPYPYPAAAGYPPMPVPPGPVNNGYIGSGWAGAPGYVPGMGSTGFAGSASMPAPGNVYSMPDRTRMPVAGHMGAAKSADSLTDEDIRMSIVSFVEDKVRRNFRESSTEWCENLEVQCKTKEDLQKGDATIHQMIDKMEREKAEAERAVQMLREKNHELQGVLRQLEHEVNEGINVDEAIDTTAPLFRQLLGSFAEEQAVEDAIYFLGEALGKDVVDVEVFLKKVRELSRKQFMLRATIQKCRERAGLPAL